MTWLDITFIVIWLIFLAVGARLGSLWTGACVIGGFLGSFMADYYAYPVAEMLGNFSGSSLVAGVLLFMIGLGLILIPGWILSRVSSALFLGFIDSTFGLVTGAFTGVVALALFVLLIVPLFPALEKKKAWRDSMFVKPFQTTLEEGFNDPNFRPASIQKKVKKEALKKVKPLTKKARKKAKEIID